MTDKKKLWEEIQKRDPNLAALIQNVSRVFGKPTVTVVFKREGA